MEGVYSSMRSSGSNSSKAPKVKTLLGDVSPIVVPNPAPPQRFIGGHSRGRFHPFPSSPIYDPYASSESPTSPLIRYLRSAGSNSNSGGRTPLAPIDNLTDAVPPAMFHTPVKVEEDVLVMDGVLVKPKATTTNRLRASVTSSVSGGLSSSSSPSTGGKENSNGGCSSSNTDTCRSWEKFGSCRSGAKCLFVHGKEELHPNSTRQTSNKNKAESQICKSYTSGSCSYGTKCRFAHPQDKPTVPTIKPQGQQHPAVGEMTLLMAPETVSPVKLEQQPPSSGSRSSMPTGCVNPDWSPMDDAIEVTLPSSSSSSTSISASSREDLDAYIHTFLHGPPKSKRLQACTEISQDSSA